MNNEKFLAYAQGFTSFLSCNLPGHLFALVERILLFGSVARREATKESDVDLFIEVREGEQEVEAAVTRIIDRFYQSPPFTKYWKLLRMDNPISCKVGRLSDWEDLYPSLVQDGIILYGKYRPQDLEGAPALLFSWENVKPESKRVTLNRKLFGYVKDRKVYPGLVSRHRARRIAKGALLVPLENRRIFEELFHSLEVPLRVHSLLEV